MYKKLGLRTVLSLFLSVTSVYSADYPCPDFLADGANLPEVIKKIKMNPRQPGGASDNKGIYNDGTFFWTVYDHVGLIEGTHRNRNRIYGGIKNEWDAHNGDATYQVNYITPTNLAAAVPGHLNVELLNPTGRTEPIIDFADVYDKIDARHRDDWENMHAAAYKIFVEDLAHYPAKFMKIYLIRDPEADRLAREEADRLRLAQEEADRLAREEADRLAREEADRLAREEADRLAREEADRLAREEADRLAREEADRLAREEADRLARQEADRLAREARARRQEADRLQREEAARRQEEARVEREARARRQEADRLQREEAAQRQEEARVEREARARRQEAERLQREEAARRQEEARVEREAQGRRQETDRLTREAEDVRRLRSEGEVQRTRQQAPRVISDLSQTVRVALPDTVEPVSVLSAIPQTVVAALPNTVAKPIPSVQELVSHRAVTQTGGVLTVTGTDQPINGVGMLNGRKCVFRNGKPISTIKE